MTNKYISIVEPDENRATRNWSCVLPNSRRDSSWESSTQQSKLESEAGMGVYEQLQDTTAIFSQI